ncbi:MAG: prepilin-type N-terminal cleavage/methylation domain-containing protein, partial [Methylocella sp.]
MPFERPGEEGRASAGFTLLEALVALAVAAVSLAATGLLMAGNIRGSGRIE